MIRRSLVIASLALVFAVSSVAVSFATTCGVMSIVSIASTDTGEGSQIWLKNETGASCGVIAAGGQMLFNLPVGQSDKTLAVALTAMSLGKNLWVAFDDSTDPGVIQVLSMQN